LINEAGEMRSFNELGSVVNGKPLSSISSST
jgi:hypothetical protein